MRKYYKYKINLTFGNILAIIVFVLATIPAFIFSDGYVIDYDIKFLSIFLLVYLLWTFLHEILHGIGHMICGVKRNELSFGAYLEKGILFCLVRREVNKKGILVSLLFPFFFIGVVTYIIGLLINNQLLILLSIFNISGASIDLLMFYNFIKLGNDITYIEPGDGTSFYIMSNRDINKLTGFTLLEKGEYNKDMFNIQNKVFDISKSSIVILGLIVVMSLVLIFI